jgi:hypothetical protein
LKGNSYATLCHTHSLFDALRKHPAETTSQLRGFRGDPWDTGRGLKERDLGNSLFGVDQCAPLKELQTLAVSYPL